MSPSPPSSPTSATDPATGGAWLGRVQALLAKAERTDFPEEAEALLAKAQDLMARHAISEAMVQAARARDGGSGESVTSLRVVVDAPYAGAKRTLLGAVAAANGCRTIYLGGGADGRHAPPVPPRLPARLRRPGGPTAPRGRRGGPGRRPGRAGARLGGGRGVGPTRRRGGPGPAGCLPPHPQRPHHGVVRSRVAQREVGRRPGRAGPAGAGLQGRSLSVRGSPGRPSTRSPMMLRWISLVPPSMELARARRNILRLEPGGPTRPRFSDRRIS